MTSVQPGWVIRGALRTEDGGGMFVNRLVATLDLTLDGTTFAVPAGNIKNISINLRSYGFSVSLDFWFVCLKEQSEDKVYAKFIKDELATAKFTVDRKFDKVGASSEPLVLKGIVENRAFSERVFGGIKGEPILHRHYHLDFSDRGQVLWRQHFPTALYVDKKLSELIDDNRPDGVKVTHEWTAGKVKHPVLSLALGASDTGARGASFYDYLHWLLDRMQTGLYYDYKTDSYTISDKKKEFGGAVSSDPEDVEELRAVFRPISRTSVSVLNGCASAATTEKAIENKLKVTGVQREYFLRSSVASDLTNRTALETKRHAQRKEGTEIDFARYPSTTMRPNILVKFDEWCNTIHQSKQQCRVGSVNIEATAESQGATDNAEDDSNSYEVIYSTQLEAKAETLFDYPQYRVPQWTVRVEGVVVSEVGEDKQETYQPYKDDDTSIDYYKVEIPLWKKQKVIVTYEPLFEPGHFYFPIYKGARVLVELGHNRASIVGFVDWRAGARLPLESQGNHLLLGKKAEDQTSITHVYKDAKPQLSIDRCNGKDKQKLEVSEGRVYFETIATED